MGSGERLDFLHVLENISSGVCGTSFAGFFNMLFLYRRNSKILTDNRPKRRIFKDNERYLQTKQWPTSGYISSKKVLHFIPRCVTIFKAFFIL